MAPLSLTFLLLSDSTIQNSESWIKHIKQLCSTRLEPNSSFEAEKSLKRLHGEHSGIDYKSILTTLKSANRLEAEMHAENSSITYAACFSSTDRSRTLICMFVYGCQYLSGIIFVLGYQSYYYQLAGFGAQKSFLLGMLNNCSMFVANILSWPLLTVIGRRWLIVWGQFMCGIALLIIGGASLPEKYTTNLVTIAFMFVWVCLLRIVSGRYQVTVC